MGIHAEATDKGRSTTSLESYRVAGRLHYQLRSLKNARRVYRFTPNALNRQPSICLIPPLTLPDKHRVGLLKYLYLSASKASDFE